MTTLSNARGKANLLRPYNSELIIPTIPGGGDTDVLKTLVATSQLPQFGSNMFESNHPGGHTIKHPGRPNFSRQLSVTFNEDNNMSVYNALKGWDDLVFDVETGAQAPDEVVKVQAFINVLNLNKEVTREITLYGFVIEQVSDTSMDNSQDAPVQIQATFSYDYFK